MGEPATPPPAERKATRELAAAIVEAVRNDEPMPLKWGALNTRASTEELLFQLAQEIMLLTSDTYVGLQTERDQLRRWLAAACSELDDTGGEFAATVAARIREEAGIES